MIHNEKEYQRNWYKDSDYRIKVKKSNLRDVEREKYLRRDKKNEIQPT